MIGGIEAGGTTFRCATATSPLSIAEQVTIGTTTPHQTLAQVSQFFRSHRVTRLGIASFGPLELDPKHPSYGCILDTPKLAWRNCDILRALTTELDIPARIDTDVAAAVLAEYHYGAAQGSVGCVYATVGTGIGAASLVNGATPTALFHEEMGHMLIPRHPDDEYASVCPAHDSCLEGLASATAIEHRWQCPAHELPASHTCWDIEAHYLAIFCVNVMRILSPDIILLGGGVLCSPGLLGKIHKKFNELMNGYHSVATADIPKLIQHAHTEPNAGLIGALHLAT